MPAEEIDEAIEEATPVPNGLPEAPASATVRVWIDGYGVLLTMRSEKMDDVVRKLEFIIGKAKEKGWESTWKKEEKGKEFICSECGAEATYKEGTSKAGKPWKAIFCTKNKEHVKWLNNLNKKG